MTLVPPNLVFGFENPNQNQKSHMPEHHSAVDSFVISATDDFFSNRLPFQIPFEVTFDRNEDNLHWLNPDHLHLIVFCL